MVTLLISTAAQAVTPASHAVGMAIRAGEVIGAAAACGIPEDRLVAVSATSITLIRETARSETEIRRAKAAYERAAARGEAAMRARGEKDCAAAIQAFERAESN